MRSESAMFPSRRRGAIRNRNTDTDILGLDQEKAMYRDTRANDVVGQETCLEVYGVKVLCTETQLRLIEH